MSIQTLQNDVQRAQRDISDLNRKLSNLSKKEADLSQKLARAQGGLASARSLSSLQSKTREIAKLQADIGRVQKDKADLNKRIGDKTKDLHRAQERLAKEEESEKRRLAEAEKKLRREMTDYRRQVDGQLSSQRFIGQEWPGVSSSPIAENRSEHDLFISHASEDKDDFVRPLAETLTELGISVWYDEFQLKVGDSLRRSIDHGLASSRYGIVVLSASFFAKNWPQYELDGLVAREMRGVKVILPIWHKVTKDEVMDYSPSLADKVALNSSLLSIEEIARQLADVVKP